jgi:uncharacterized membrane protein
MKKLTTYFLKGLAFLVPVVATIFVVYIVFVKIDKLFKFPIPGVGFVITIVAITAIGFIGSNFLTKKVVHTVDNLFSRLPLIKMIYTSARDLTFAFVGDRKGFRPVAVSLSPGSNIKVIGFATKEGLEELGLADNVAVYLPQSYNFAGNVIVVPKEQVIPINADSADVMKFIVSGGIAQTYRAT